MLNTSELRVSVTIDNESYFYGYIYIPSTSPSDDFFYEYSFNALGALAALSNYSILDFYNDWNVLIDGPEGYNKFRVFARLMARFIDVKNFVTNDIDFLCQRKFAWQNGTTWKEYYLNDLLFSKDYWYNIFFQNRYDNRLENVFQLLNEFKNDFFFYPSIIYDGSDFKLKIMEKDIDITRLDSPIVKHRSKETNYFMNQLIVDLFGRPNSMDSSGLKFDTGFNGNNFGDLVEHFMKHTNIDRSVTATDDDDAFMTNMLIYVKDDPDTLPGYANLLQRITNYNGSYVDYNSLQEAIFEPIKQIYNNNINWERLTVKGLKGIKSNVAKMEYLMPAYRFPFEGNEYYIHSVNKSLERNESEVLGLII